MIEWPTVKLAEITHPPQYGAIAKGSDERVGPLFVRQTDIKSGRVDWTGVPYCDLPPAHFAKYALQRGDVLISRLGNGVGNAAPVDEPHGAVFAGYLVRFQADRDRVDPCFLGYNLQSQAWRDHVAGYRSGAAQPTLNAKQMGAFAFLLPPLPEQRAIARTLGALDDKIESNRRAVATIGDLTDAMREEFVASVESFTAPLADLVKFNRTSIKPGSTEDLLYIDIASVSPGKINSVDRYTWDKAPSRARRGVKDGDVIFSTVRPGRRSYALVLAPEPDVVASTGFAVMSPTERLGSSMLTSMVGTVEFAEYLESVSHGSAYPAVSIKSMGNYVARVPADIDDVTAFEERTMPMRRRGHQLEIESQRLAALRDTLLPELLSDRMCVAGAQEVAA